MIFIKKKMMEYEKLFRVGQIGPTIHVKKRFSKNFFFEKSLSGGGRLVCWSGVVGSWGSLNKGRLIQVQQTNKRIIFYFHDIFSPFFSPMCDQVSKKTCFLNKNCFHFL